MTFARHVCLIQAEMSQVGRQMLLNIIQKAYEKDNPCHYSHIRMANDGSTDRLEESV